VKLVRLGTLDSRVRTDFDDLVLTTLASPTAIRGKTTTPTTGRRIHHPGVTKHKNKQTSRSPIAIR
jgi:hypothetical protein